MLTKAEIWFDQSLFKLNRKSFIYYAVTIAMDIYI